ncbi:DUF2490 domain-containing protein [Fulvivirga sp. RKSG066]|uniref:DUF2490 domain-containing protein n=1 Tax=Fulvivirga aurantia TaxID=2529383 RepID=UPI0012BD77F0|nr:DUF2490 domain-containing protein [Fulvivirga aurantia]MTI20883.1 DUF2490 domain-containing protein [Fulvivirga aurantia]
MHKSKLLKLAFFGLFLFSFSQSIAQRDVQRDNFIWVTYSLTKPLNNGLSLGFMVQSRRYAFPDRQHQLLGGPKVTKRFDSNIVLGGGFIYFRQALPVSRGEVDLVRPELRPFQEIGITNDIGEWSVGHRLMVEERWFRETEGNELVDGYFFQVRVRYRLMLQRALGKSERLKAVISNELMVQGADPEITNIFDQNRFYAGFKLKQSDRISIDAGYMYWYQQFPDITSFASFHIINLALTHTLK